MNKRIQLTESDIRRMIFEAVNEITAEQDLNKNIMQLIAKYKTIPEMLNAWINVVQSTDEYQANRSKIKWRLKHMDLKTPEYWALYYLCVHSFDSGRLGFFMKKDILDIMNKLEYDTHRQILKNNVVAYKVINKLRDCVDEAFLRNEVISYFPLIKNENSFQTFKQVIKQFAIHYLRKVDFGYFMDNVSNDSIYNDETNQVPDGLRDPVKGDYSNTMKFIKSTLELFLNDDYMSDINKFTISKNSMGVPDNRPGLKTAVKFILNNFETIFTPKTLSIFDNLTRVYDKKTGRYQYTNVIRGKEFLKILVSKTIVKYFVKSVLKQRPIKTRTGYICTSGDKEFDKFCNLILKNHFHIDNATGKPVFDNNYEDCLSYISDKIEPMWTILGQGYLNNGEENKLGKGAEIIRRSKAYQRGRLQPLSNPGIANETIRRIVSETIQRNIKK